MNKLLTEFLGTFFLALTVGVAAVLGAAGPGAPIAIGAVLMVMIYAGGHVSGGHYNPAVTLGVFLRGRFDAADLLPYVAAQCAGAALAAVLTTAVFAEAFPALGPIAPASFSAVPAVLASEFLFTFALVYVVLHVATAPKTAGNDFYGAAIGTTVMVGAFTVGSISLGGFNPAVSLSLMLEGKLAVADVWLHWAPQLLGGAAAAGVFKLQGVDENAAALGL